MTPGLKHCTLIGEFSVKCTKYEKMTISLLFFFKSTFYQICTQNSVEYMREYNSKVFLDNMLTCVDVYFANSLFFIFFVYFERIANLNIDFDSQ